MHESVPSAKSTRRSAHATRSMAGGLVLITALWRWLMRKLRNKYQPERHYMRGPGPKWHKRNR